MPSIDSKEMVDAMIKNNGRYLDDPQCLQISQYTNQWGGTTYHLAYSNYDVDALYSSPYVHDVKVLWSRP